MGVTKEAKARAFQRDRYYRDLPSRVRCACDNPRCSDRLVLAEYDMDGLPSLILVSNWHGPMRIALNLENTEALIAMLEDFRRCEGLKEITRLGQEMGGYDRR